MTRPSYGSTGVIEITEFAADATNNEFELQFAPAAGDRPNIAPALAATKITLGDVHALA